MVAGTSAASSLRYVVVLCSWLGKLCVLVIVCGFGGYAVGAILLSYDSVGYYGPNVAFSVWFVRFSILLVWFRIRLGLFSFW